MELSRRIRVLVVDDHALVREGLLRLLEAEPDMEPVGEAATGVEALAAVERARPDVVLADVRMPEMSGVELTRVLRAAHPEIRVLVLSAFPEHAAEAFAAGASGYLLKSARGVELLATLRSVFLGATVIQEPLAQALGFGLRSHAPDHHLLSPRELEVLALVVRGLTNRAIGRELGIGTRTADQHVHSIFVKTGVRSRAEAVRYALERQLVASSAAF